MRYSIVLLTFAALLMAAPLRAEVPFLFPVSGVLTDMDDVPLEGDHEVVFTFYNAITGGTVLGGETQSVTFQGGLFHAYIGQETSGGLNVTPFIQTDEIWLGIKVGSDSEMSRVRLAAVPWAFEAFQCEQVTNLTTAGIQAAIPAGACGANAAMRGWSGGSAQCVTLPDISSFVTHGDIGTAVQAPISQLQPCDHGVEEIDANGTVTCRAASAVVAACGVGAAGGSGDNYLGSDGVCHPAPHACTAGQYLDGNGTCQEAPHKCTANQYLDGNGTCRNTTFACTANQYLDGSGTCQEAPHKCTANQYLDGDGTCRTAPHSCATGQYLNGNGNCVAMSVSGTANRLAMFTSGTAVGNSIVTQSGTSGIAVAGNLNVTGTTTSGRLATPFHSTTHAWDPSNANYGTIAANAGPYTCDASTRGHIATMKVNLLTIEIDALCYCTATRMPPNPHVYHWRCFY